MIPYMSAVFGAIGAFASNKYYLEQQLVPMQVYMDDIDNIMQHLPDERYKCRLRELENAYRDIMGFDYSVRVRTAPHNFELFKALRMKFDRTPKSETLMNRLFPGITLNPETPLVVFNSNIAKLNENEEQVKNTDQNIYLSVGKTSEYKGSMISGYTYKYTIKCWENGTLRGETLAMWQTDVEKKMKEFRLLKGLNSVYIQPYDVNAEGKYDDEYAFGNNVNDEYTWVDKIHFYRGVYPPLSPFTCGNIEQISFKTMNNNGWTHKALVSVVKSWTHVEYIYLAMKSMFEELGTIASLELKELMSVNKFASKKAIGNPNAPSYTKKRLEQQYSMST